VLEIRTRGRRGHECWRKGGSRQPLGAGGFQSSPLLLRFAAVFRLSGLQLFFRLLLCRLFSSGRGTSSRMLSDQAPGNRLLSLQLFLSQPLPGQRAMCAAIASVVSGIEGFRPEPVTPEEVTAKLEERRADRKYYCSADRKVLMKTIGSDVYMQQKCFRTYLASSRKIRRQRQSSSAHSVRSGGTWVHLLRPALEAEPRGLAALSHAEGSSTEKAATLCTR